MPDMIISKLVTYRILRLMLLVRDVKRKINIDDPRFWVILPGIGDDPSQDQSVVVLYSTRILSSLQRGLYIFIRWFFIQKIGFWAHDIYDIFLV